jgi:O-antigen/teichoic acid export membrane protein
MSDMPPVQPASRGRIAGQGALLFSGFAAAQALSFARNAVLGHALSKGDFGIAASITLMLQLIETLSDLGSDRLIVQAADGANRNFLASSHTMLIARGVVLAALLAVCGPLFAEFFGVPEAAIAFQIVALVPVFKGFLHLGCRIAQRSFNTAPLILIEVAPQAVALAMIPLALSIEHSYMAVVWVSLAQALAATAISHLLAKAPYELGFDRTILKRQLAFGWPILLSALPLVAVYQGDRIIIGRLSGMEALAAYTVAFMATMVPGLVAAKAGHALMLPMFSEAIRLKRSIDGRFRLLGEATVLASALYLSLFLVAGHALIPLLFGAHYSGLGAVTGWLACMWALRMIQAVPGMALMAHGITKPFAIAGLIRAAALPFAAYAAWQGQPIATVAAIGCLFELNSLLYIAVCCERLAYGLGRGLVVRSLFLLPVALASLLVSTAMTGTTVMMAASAAAMVALVGAIAVAIMPSLRAEARRVLARHRALSELA